MPPELGLNLYLDDPDYAMLSVEGEVDVYTAPILRQKLGELADRRGLSRIVVDLESVEFLDSTGLGVLVAALNRARRQDGDVELICSRRRILRVFEITGLTKVFTIHESLDALSCAAPRRSPPRARSDAGAPPKVASPPWPSLRSGWLADVRSAGEARALSGRHSERMGGERVSGRRCSPAERVGRQRGAPRQYRDRGAGRVEARLPAPVGQRRLAPRARGAPLQRAVDHRSGV